MPEEQKHASDDHDPLPSGAEIIRSFDARDWAKAFVAYVQQIPGIARDEKTMVTWFASALMRGYDEGRTVGRSMCYRQIVEEHNEEEEEPEIP